MSKGKTKDSVISFRTFEEIEERIDHEAAKRQLKRAAFVESIFIPAFESAVATANVESYLANSKGLKEKLA